MQLHYLTLQLQLRYTTATITTTTALQLQPRPQLQLQLQLPLHYNYHYATTTATTTASTSTSAALQLWLQLHYTTTTTTLHHTTSSSCGWGDHCKHCKHSKKHNSTFRSISGFTLPSMHRNNSPLLWRPTIETSATVLCGTTGNLPREPNPPEPSRDPRAFCGSMMSANCCSLMGSWRF